MRDAGIFSGDLLVVDRAKKVKNGNVVVAFVDGEFTVKRFLKKNHFKLAVILIQKLNKLKIV